MDYVTDWDVVMKDHTLLRTDRPERYSGGVALFCEAKLGTYQALSWGV